VLGKLRMIDVRPGDLIHHARRNWRVRSVKTWPDANVQESFPLPQAAYLVRG
jgi:hypothetical protein